MTDPTRRIDTTVRDTITSLPPDEHFRYFIKEEPIVSAANSFAQSQDKSSVKDNQKGCVRNITFGDINKDLPTSPENCNDSDSSRGVFEKQISRPQTAFVESTQAREIAKARLANLKKSKFYQC
jgi:hypothetical protein